MPLTAADTVFLLELAHFSRKQAEQENIMTADALYYLRRISQGLTGAEKDYPPSAIMEMSRQYKELKKQRSAAK